MKNILYVVLLIVPVLILVGCEAPTQTPVPSGITITPTYTPTETLTPTPTDTPTYTTTPTPLFDESQVRYVLADIQLGGVDRYYRQFLDQPGIAEAIRRWDMGVRVANIASFERKIVGTWKVVYAGTDIQINGMDVILTTDQPGTPTLTPIDTITPKPAYNEAGVRYDITLMQLFRSFDIAFRTKTDPDDVEAVRRWDAGVRVVNISDFARAVSEPNGDFIWVVYKGTNTPINGMDVILTTDPGTPKP